jgi:hypothetical protein
LIGNEFQDLHGLFQADEYMPPDWRPLRAAEPIPRASRKR